MVTDREEEMIKSLVSSGYSKSDPRYCLGICSTCRIYLLHAQNTEEKSIFVSESFGISLPLETRSNQECHCLICSRGRLNGPSWNSFKKSCHQNKMVHISGNQKLCHVCFSKVNNTS